MTKYALVTGGSRGIGKAISIELAKIGYSILINYVSNEKSAIDTLNQIVEMGGNAELLQFDVADPQKIEDSLEKWDILHPNDYISVLINNAGIRKDSLMIFMQNKQWNDVLNTTLNGFFYTTRRVLKNMLTHRN